MGLAVVLPSNVSDTPSEVAPPPAPRRRLRPGLGTLLVSLLGVVVLIGAFLYFGMNGSPFGRSTPRTAAPATGQATATAPNVANGPTATPAEATAIQRLIQRGDEAQIQALANKDSTPLQDIGTPEYVDEIVATNEDLLDAGVVSIQLVRIEWGPIVVDGNTATASCYETWTTTFADGSVDQSRDLNVYTLVQQNGAWKIQADDHPNAPGR